MSLSMLASSIASSSRHPARSPVLQCYSTTPICSRGISTSPYGRTHVWKRREPKLPNPMVPKFPQRVIRSDGSTFVHHTTSPRSSITLTRDLSNHPLWNPHLMSENEADEDASTGRLGRFRRRFEGIGEVEDMWGTTPAEENPAANHIENLVEAVKSQQKPKGGK